MWHLCEVKFTPGMCDRLQEMRVTAGACQAWYSYNVTAQQQLTRHATRQSMVSDTVHIFSGQLR